MFQFRPAFRCFALRRGCQEFLNIGLATAAVTSLQLSIPSTLFDLESGYSRCYSCQTSRQQSISSQRVSEKAVNYFGTSSEQSADLMSYHRRDRIRCNGSCSCTVIFDEIIRDVTEKVDFELYFNEFRKDDECFEKGSSLNLFIGMETKTHVDLNIREDSVKTKRGQVHGLAWNPNKAVLKMVGVKTVNSHRRRIHVYYRSSYISIKIHIIDPLFTFWYPCKITIYVHLQIRINLTPIP